MGKGEYSLVLLHGFGANGRDLLSLREPGLQVFCPEGPIDLGQLSPGARAWFMIDLDNLSFNTQQFDESCQLLLQVLETLGLKPSKTILGGFSQGAMMALEVALTSETPFLGLALFSSTPTDSEGLLPRASRVKTKFFQSHGIYDELLPFAAAHTLFHKLQEAGWQGDFVSFPGGHEIPQESVSSFKEFIHALID